MNINFNPRGSAEVRRLKSSMSRKRDIFPSPNKNTNHVTLPPILKRIKSNTEKWKATQKIQSAQSNSALTAQSYHNLIRQILPKPTSSCANRPMSVESLPNISMPMKRFKATSNSGKITTMQGHAMNQPLRTIVKNMSHVTELLMRTYKLKDAHLVRNILIYSKSLVKPNTSTVDRAVFTAQMIHTFGITDEFIIERIFASRAFTWKNCLKYEEYAGIVCTFITSNDYIKANYAFDVYDDNSSNVIDNTEFNKFLRPCVAAIKDEFGNEVLVDEAVEELKWVLLAMFGIGGVKQPNNGNGNTNNTDAKKLVSSSIDRNVWLEYVIPRMDLVECLGQCLPSSDKLRDFLHTVRGDREAMEVSRYYRLERHRCLGRYSSRIMDATQELYPVVLEYEENLKPNHR